MSPSVYIYGAFGLAVAVLWGLYQYESVKVEREQAHRKGLENSLAVAESEIARAADVAAYNRDVANGFKAEVSRQREIAAREAKKSADRLRENNDLRRKITNAPENPPVPDAIELVLESVRMRGPVAGESGAPASGGDEAGKGGDADPAGHELPPGTDPAPEAPGS